MSIIQKQDVSYLFSSLNSSSKSSSNFFDYSWVSDYASIKSGSYSKLVKAYYKSMESDDSTSSTSTTDKTSTTSTSISQDSSKTLAAIKSSTDDLKELALELVDSGKDSLFTKKEIVTKNEDGTETKTEGYDMDAIYKAVSTFVDNYNNVMDDVKESDSSTVQSAVNNMTNITNIYTKSLEKLGITIGDDDKLTLNEDTFKAADTDKVKEMFNGSHSFAASISSQASFVNSAATREASKANIYTGSGTYSNNYSTGDIFSSLF